MKYAISKDGSKIAYETLGTGPVLINITGAICHRTFKPVADDVKIFAHEFTVINYDRRGRGDSDDNLPYSIEKEIDDIEALIESCGENVNLYGHSSGAILAMEAAIRLPNKINKIFLYEPSYVLNESEQKDYDQLIQKVSTHLAAKEFSQALRAFLVGIGMPKFFVYLLPLMPGWKKLKALAPTLIYDMEMTRILPPLQHLSSINTPMMISYGQKSSESIKEVSVAISKVVRSAQLVEVPKQDHLVSPKILLPMFKDFF